MKNRTQLKWMVLLAVAVILPTVSLLWFMSRVVANERLVIRQKLAVIYEQKLKEAGDQAKRRINERFDAFSGADWARDPYGLLRHLVLAEKFQGVVLWDREGKEIYPLAREETVSNDPAFDALLAEAWELEFVDQDYAAAAERYRQLPASADSRGGAGVVRCLAKLGRWDEAMEAATESKEVSAASARLLLLSLMQQAPDSSDRTKSMVQLVHALDDDLFRSDNDGSTSSDFSATAEYLPAEQNLFIARKLILSLEAMEFSGKESLIDHLAQLIGAEGLSLALAEEYPGPSGPPDTIVPTMLDGDRLYMIRHPTPSFGEMMIIMSSEGLASALDGYRSALSESDARFRILDPWGNLIAGKAGEGISAIVSGPLPMGFPDGTVELFFDDGEMFNKAAGRQITVYIWTGVLVILLILLVGAFAVLAVGHQIRLNRMKNDFIATVSHELKTPLASMRLLVDTLLEGRIRDEAHAEEYLQMIARENERLTRMIENFLSFSRMERNKNAFSLEPASPQAIAEDAADCVCTKYRSNHCRLETDLAVNLPNISADHDAMVTVLINLLDNACKYTTDDKEIRLAVFADADEVCFAVSDQGIGLTNRQIRRIFDSFYQVDNSLARTREGCGLGLSIVQFIVNAHKGHIEVESEPGKGTTFTVRLPICRKNGSMTND